MKKIITLSCLMLLCSFAGMAQKFALIDMEYILKNIPAYEMTNEQLSQVSKKWQNEVEAIQQEAQNMYKNYQSDLVFLSAEMKTKREEEIVKKEQEAQDLKRKYFGPEGELYKKRESLMKPIQDEVYNAVKEISDLLQLPLTGTARMEAYDISNINGFENVGSMVVYEKGKPKRSDYRKFKIKSVSGPDDYACMREVLTRRFRHGMEESKELEEQEMDQEYGSFTKFPDLILMDGGRGQVNIALSVLEELGINIPVCGMVKDDNHRTRGLYYHNIELPIDTHSEGFKLITRIQDEAHRFAIEYHRSLRSKTQVKSVLDDIPGVGPARRKALQASVEELMEIPEMNERTAEEIVTFFASQTGQPVVH